MVVAAGPLRGGPQGWARSSGRAGSVLQGGWPRGVPREAVAFQGGPRDVRNDGQTLSGRMKPGGLQFQLVDLFGFSQAGPFT